MTPRELVNWMKSIALPFWSREGWDAANGLFFERMHMDASPDDQAIMRVRVQFRQIYTYAHAFELGWSKEGAETALKGFTGLEKHFRNRDGQRGYVHLLNPDLSVANTRRDSYDHAFAVLALSWLWHVTGDAKVRKALDDVLAFVDHSLTAADGSLLEGFPASQPRRQNPQMHWFEAMLALSAHGYPGAEERLDRAFRQFMRMTVQGTQPIIEYFNDDWQPVPGPNGKVLEPGHLAEWVWLLRQHQSLTQQDHSALTQMLLSAASKFLNGDRLVDEALTDGTITKPANRSWLATEWAKAWIAEAEYGRKDARTSAETALSAMAKWHLGRPFAAGWVDQITAAGEDVSSPVPASILYHVFVAVAEADRVLLKTAA